jgi:hypothetical protein
MDAKQARKLASEARVTVLNPILDTIEKACSLGELSCTYSFHNDEPMELKQAMETMLKAKGYDVDLEGYGGRNYLTISWK